MTPPRKVVSWHEHFLNMAEAVSQRSKHPRVQQGAVIVNWDNRVISTGYNGSPSGYPEDKIDWTLGMEERNGFELIHAEENALLFAGIERTKGCRMYVTGLPCCNCFMRAVHCGIRQIIVGKRECVSPRHKNLDMLINLIVNSLVTIWEYDKEKGMAVAVGSSELFSSTLP